LSYARGIVASSSTVSHCIVQSRISQRLSGLCAGDDFPAGNPGPQEVLPAGHVGDDGREDLGLGQGRAFLQPMGQLVGQLTVHGDDVLTLGLAVPDRDGTRFKVDVRPPQASEIALTETRQCGSHVPRLPSATLGRGRRAGSSSVSGLRTRRPSFRSSCLEAKVSGLDSTRFAAENASGQTASGRITARDRPDAPLSEPEKCLLMLKVVIESLESSAMVSCPAHSRTEHELI